MHKISVLLLAILLISLTGCEDKKQNDGSIPIENTTQVLQQTKTDTQDHSAFKIAKKHTPTTKVSKTKTAPIENFNQGYTLYFSTDSYGREVNENLLQSVEVFSWPYNFVASRSIPVWFTEDTGNGRSV